MKAVISALALTSALIAAAPANAALTDYAFSGALSDGSKFDGAFTVDDTKNSFSQFSNFYTNVGGMTLKTVFSLRTDAKSYFVIGVTNNTLSFSLGLNAKSNNQFQLLDLKLGDLNQSRTLLSNKGVSTYGSGTISLANTAAVPEPGTWALMILGFGAVGYAMRRRQKVAVRFA